MLHGPGYVLDEHRCALVARYLGDLLRIYRAGNKALPPQLVVMADDLSIAAREAAEFREFRASTRGRGTRKFRETPTPQASDQPVRWLTTKEAADELGMSDGYARRLARRGDVHASRGRSGAWLIDADSLTVWRQSAPHREEHDTETG